jgi:hypothetical protein
MLVSLGEAELDRMFECADATLTLLCDTEAIDISSAIDDLDTYAQWISTSACNSQQLAEFMRIMAESEETSEMRELYLSSSQAIDDGAAQIAATANQFFGAESDCEQQQHFAEVRSVLAKQQADIKHVVARAKAQRHFVKGIDCQHESTKLVDDSSVEQCDTVDHTLSTQSSTPKETRKHRNLDTEQLAVEREDSSDRLVPRESRANRQAQQQSKPESPTPSSPPLPTTTTAASATPTPAATRTSTPAPAPAAQWKPETMGEVASYMQDVAQQNAKQHDVLAGGTDLSAAITALARAAEVCTTACTRMQVSF